MLDIKLHMLLEQLKETESRWALEQVTCGFLVVMEESADGQQTVQGRGFTGVLPRLSVLSIFKKCLISTRLTLSFGP